MLDQPTMPQDFVHGDDAPGAADEPRAGAARVAIRAVAPAALHGLGGALGDEAQLDAVALGGLVRARRRRRRRGARLVPGGGRAPPEDIAAWEGVRAASEALGDHVRRRSPPRSSAALCQDDERGAEFWEKAGLILLEHTDAKDDAEIAFERAFERDPRRAVAFDKLFRARPRAQRGRSRSSRSSRSASRSRSEEAEIGKLYWERARVLRKKGDRDGALSALENVTMLEPDHVGALALSGEIYITSGDFAEAAPLLGAPLDQPEAPHAAAPDVGHRRRRPLREQARAAREGARGPGRPAQGRALDACRCASGSPASPRAPARGREATAILETLMSERDKTRGPHRGGAARRWPSGATSSRSRPGRVRGRERLLDEAPDDGEAIDFVLTTGFDTAFRTRVLGRAKRR